MSIIADTYEPCRHLDTFFVAGFQRYDGSLVIDKMAPGKKVQLVPEPKNPFDSNAIMLRFKGKKIGYVPAKNNWLMSTMSYYGHGDCFECRIIQVDPKADPWEQVRVAVYVTDAREGQAAE